MTTSLTSAVTPFSPLRSSPEPATLSRSTSPFAPCSTPPLSLLLAVSSPTQSRTASAYSLPPYCPSAEINSFPCLSLSSASGSSISLTLSLRLTTYRLPSAYPAPCLPPHSVTPYLRSSGDTNCSA